MAKATVQAALGPVALKHLSADSPDKKYAEIVLMICVLSIVLTAPTGAILISLSGTKLLTKTTQPQITEGEDFYDILCFLTLDLSLKESIKYFMRFLNFKIKS